MRVFKKDWRYDVNFPIAIFIASIVVYSIVTVGISWFMPEQSDFFKSSYGILYVFYSWFIFLYPAIIFRGVCPKLGKEKLYLNTANIPYSRKGLFIKGLKEWFLIAPIFVLFTTFIEAILIKADQSFLEAYISSLEEISGMIIVALIINFQLISAMIIHLARKIKVYKIIIGIFLINISVITICAAISSFINIEIIKNLELTGVGYVILIICFISSLIGFLISFRDIEKISS